MSRTNLRTVFDHTEAPFPPATKLSRRMRPPDLEIKATTGSRVLLRGDKNAKSGRRESRLGFSRFFGRHRAVNGTEAVEKPESKSSDDISTTIGGTPYDLQPQGLKSEVHLAPLRDIGTTSRPSTAGVRSPPYTPSPGSSPMAAVGKRLGSNATATTPWDPVPLFQAWPQAVRTATLPACLQADSLLRMHNKKEMLPTVNHPDLVDDKDMFVAMAKKRHRRSSSSFKLDWTTKIYMLVTSGYLLQFCGDGPHDCLPEKVVQLTKYSAAFASDVIPGRHWVLQVSSVFEDGALTSQDTRSLLGKFGLREKERRQASDILMIFENAADMDSWMNLLRREIEVLGGKAPLTETGTPRLSDEHTPSPISPAGRTIVLKDPNFGRTGSLPGMQWDAAVTDDPELHPLPEYPPDHSFDDNSTTNSFVSHDGRQLDGLRDSANRFSFMSAARTIVTSDSSACNSPVRDSFGSGSQGSQPSEDVTPLADEMDKANLRPNAAEIENRRQSYRSSNMFFDPNAPHATHRQHSSLSVVQEPPNFSLPNTAARRRAASQVAIDPVQISSTTTAPGRPPRRSRRPPPPTLGFTRPLSIVADSPSPSRSLSRNPMDTMESRDICSPLDSPSIFTSWATENTRLEYDLSSRVSGQQANTTSFQVSMHTGPRKYASMNSLRPAEHTSLWDDAPKKPSHLAPSPSFVRGISPMRFPQPPQSANSVIPRSMSSMDVPNLLSPPRSRSPIQRAMASQKRASMYNLQAPATISRRGSISVFDNNTGHRPTQSEHYEASFRSRSPAPRRASMLSVVSSRHKRAGSCSSARSFHVLDSRRSMPQMPPGSLVTSPLLVTSPVVAVAGPPPAPPPNKALPPIPVSKKRRSGSVPPPPLMRVSQSMANLPGGEF